MHLQIRRSSCAAIACLLLAGRGDAQYRRQPAVDDVPVDHGDSDTLSRCATPLSRTAHAQARRRRDKFTRTAQIGSCHAVRARAEQDH